VFPGGTSETTDLKLARFPTRSTLPRGFAFYLADPISSVHKITRMSELRSLVPDEHRFVEAGFVPRDQFFNHWSFPLRHPPTIREIWVIRGFPLRTHRSQTGYHG
jgi:hypothetical protein